jgi:hypothetical protein
MHNFSSRNTNLANANRLNPEAKVYINDLETENETESDMDLETENETEINTETLKETKPVRALTIAEEIDALTDPSFMTSLARGLAVVKAFSDQRRAMTIAQISHKTGIPRTAVRRC